ARGYLVGSLQPTVPLREEARQAAETAFTLQPNLGEAILANGYYHYACLKDYKAPLGYFAQIGAGFLNCWLMSHGDEASGTGAMPTSTKPSGLTRTTFSCLLTRRIRIPYFVVSPMRCESLIRS